MASKIELPKGFDAVTIDHDGESQVVTFLGTHYHPGYRGPYPNEILKIFVEGDTAQLIERTSQNGDHSFRRVSFESSEDVVVESVSTKNIRLGVYHNPGLPLEYFETQNSLPLLRGVWVRYGLESNSIAKVGIATPIAADARLDFEYDVCQEKFRVSRVRLQSDGTLGPSYFLGKSSISNPLVVSDDHFIGQKMFSVESKNEVVVNIVDIVRDFEGIQRLETTTIPRSLPQEYVFEARKQLDNLL